MTKQTKARATLKTAVVEVLEEKEAELPTDQKQRLATEVFNLSLKALSEEIKASNMPALLPSSKDAKLRRTSTSSRRSLSRTASTSSHPLQVLSPNRIPPSPAGSAFKRSPSISLNLKRSPSSTIVVLQRRTSVAECACVALSALRALKAQKGKSGANPDLQLEHGLCALVGKLLQLGLTELAIKQLRALRMRLDDLLTGKEIKTSTKAETKAVPKKSGENKGQISLADLLRFDNAQPSGGLLCLMISFQSHVLRMMAADKRISVLGEAVGYLKPSNPNSPSGLILRSLSEKAQSTDKVAQQLQSLAQTMWAMGSPSSNSRTDSASTEKARLKATIMFRLQVVSFELRVLWWSIAGHCPDVELELWTPFSRCLSAFTRQAVPPSKDDYSVASDCLSSLQALDSSTKGDSKPYQTVLKSLAQLARQTGHQSEAVTFLTQSAFTSNSKNALGVVWCTNHCQIASLLLEKKSRGSALEGLTNIQNATQGLRGDLRASSTDLDGLFFEAAKLNRLTMLYISGRVKLSEGEATESPEWNELQTSLGEFAQTFSPFLLRYLGEPPQDMEGKSFSQYVKRMSRTRNNALSTIEAAVAMSRSSIVDGTPSWELAESILTNYTTIADHLETTVYEDNADTPAISRSKHSPHVNLSNVYWARYLHDKQAGCEARQLWKSLRRAVNLLRDRPMADKIDGFATVKLERLAQTYVDLHRTIEAKETFEEAIRCHLGAGVLQRLTLKANTASFQSICTDVEDQTGAFRRVLAAFIGFVSGHNQGQSSSHFFDDSALPRGERGLLLEIQLMIIAELAKGKGVQQPDSLNGLVRTLLTVYDCSTYPLRRLRVILRLLRFSSSGAATLDSSILSSLQAEIAGNSIDDVGLSNDTGLQRYATYLEGARTVCAFFHWGQTQPEVLDKAVSIWSTLLEGDKPEIELCVENTEDMAKQLEIVVDYFDMQGLWLSKLRALDLLSNLYEIKRMDDASPQTKALSRLGLQYSRLGYSGKAGSLLAKAQVCLEKSQVSLLDKLTWHFSYAEYLLDIGNTERW
jgi:separase